MKSNVLKIVLPMAVAAFGLASAGSTSNSKPVAQMGYHRINNPFQCIAVQNCDELGGFACKAPDGVTQLYSPAITCNVPLTRSTP
ncbi:DUF6520 family protein [Flavobacterium anhuiense]|uniref:DUF6520 family protein n=1 Tax=Flavobacterium anhuiense TaxID=459526 RepID=UPI0034D95C86